MKWVSPAMWLAFLQAGLAIAFAQSESPIGTWKTFDDKTGRPKSIVQIRERDGALSGKVLQVLESPDGPHPLCKLCGGERKDQPIEGMTILWGATRKGVSWSHGEILDPENGKIYRVTLTPLDGGEKLNVRGYIGVRLIGRSQIWQRQEEKTNPAGQER
jgi:uncharacterized protein (DUF2147 family)